MKLKLRVGNRVLDAVDGPLKDRLEWHYRTFFPKSVKSLEREGRLQQYLSEKQDWYGRIVEQQMNAGLALYQAEELAFDAVFDRPDLVYGEKTDEDPEDAE